MPSVDDRPSTLSTVHNYNLRNQGWPSIFNCAPNAGGDGGAIKTDPVAFTKLKVGFYPSNADVIYFNKLSAAVRVASVGTYSPFHLEQYSYGNTPAAKGHFIINAFDRNRQAVSGINSIYDPIRDKEDDRPISVEFYAGRIWYLMPDGRLYFSQTLTELSNANKCYQEADPTSEDINDLVATDGGEIDIAGISQGLHLIPIRNELAVLSDNGVWSISGSGDSAFAATSQELRKITDTGAFGSETVISADGTIYYWSEGGIYRLIENEVTGLLQPENVTETTIQTFYLDIPEISKKNARAFFDKQSKKILWFYNDDAAYDGIEFKNAYNKILFFDTILQAFYTYDIGRDTTESNTPNPFIAAMVQKKPGSTLTVTADVTDSAVKVTDSAVDVTNTTTTPTTSDIKLKLLTFQLGTTDWTYTFAEFLDNTMVDWDTEMLGSGRTFTSHIETGHDISEDVIAEKDLGPVHTFFKLTETSIVSQPPLVYDLPSGCLMRAKWQWADDVSSGRWSDQEQVYRLNRHYVPAGTGPFTYGFEVVETTSQVRGKGRSLSLRFDSEAGKDFHLLGWGYPIDLMSGA